MIKVSPSILSADFTRLADEVKRLEKHVDMFHVDIMDGHFVPNISYGPIILEAVNRATNLPLEADLMISNPDKYVKAFADAGADIITIHPEADSPLKETLDKIRELGKRAGVSLNPETRLSSIEGVWDKIDHLLLMTVNPGFGGQSFIESVLPKITAAKKLITEQKLGIPIEVDGGINGQTAKLAVKAGADILVAGSYIYKSEDSLKAIESLRK
ncbi:ribulose-phosphate 3-epimerase [Candidatus Woesearchaeota archaeon]|nr:ribulose-phosphate 3-epimerase [Candidatus Woesearchaeota archaeon]